MKGALSAAFALGLLVVLAVPTGTGADAPVTWQAYEDAYHIPLGMPIQLDVVGPPGGYFNVQLNEQPYNYSAPVLVNSYQLPTSPNATGFAQLNVSIQTTTFNIGGMMATVSNGTTGPFEYLPLLITESVNTTYLQQQLQELEFNYTILQERLVAAGYAISNANQNYWFNVIVFLIGWAVVLVAIVVTRTRHADRKWGLKLKAFGHWLITEKLGAYFGDPDDIQQTPPDPDRCWVSPMFPKCAVCRTPRYREDLVRHLQLKVNPDKTPGHAIANPTEPDFMIRSRSVLRDTAVRRDAEPPNARLMQKRIAGLPDNLLDGVE